MPKLPSKIIFKAFLLAIPKSFYILHQNEKLNKREIKIDLRNRYSDYNHSNHYEIALVCSKVSIEIYMKKIKLKPAAKKVLNDPNHLH